MTFSINSAIILFYLLKKKTHEAQSTLMLNSIVWLSVFTFILKKKNLAYFVGYRNTFLKDFHLKAQNVRFSSI